MMSSPMRVLQVFAEMNRGGAETMIMNLYRNIDRSKIQFDFIVHTHEKCAFDDEIQELGGKIFRMPVYRGTNHMDYLKNWEFFFKEHSEYKIIHGHIRSTAAIYLNKAQKYGLITIVHSHNTSSGNGFSAIVKNILQFPIRYIADYFLACSKVAGEWLYGNKVCSKSNFHIINNAIDTKKFAFDKSIRDKKRKELKIEDKLVIGHVGRFHPQKNHDFLVDIFKEIYDKNENAVLMLVGEGDLEELIQEKVYKLGLVNRVIFTGVRTDVSEMFQVMDVFVFPSLYEGLGIVLIEAQASGLPCVVADSIPNEALITQNVQQVLLTESPKMWAEVILQRNSGHERTCAFIEVKKQGYDIEENYKWLQEFYLGLVEKSETRLCI